MRIDKYLTEKYGSRTKAAQAIERGWVKVNGKQVSSSYDIKPQDEITFDEGVTRFVSNGGFKLDKALTDFNLDVKDMVFADIGASNGGFTDCLFQRGAKKVYCIDVGESQLDESLKDKNVVVIDNFNARNLTRDIFGEQLNGCVIDVSFISLTYILGQVANILNDGAFVIALIKPQYECQSKNIGKRGIVKDAAVHKSVIKNIYEFAQSNNLFAQNLTNAPIIDGKNKEYLILLTKNGQTKYKFEQLIKYVKL
jgi:23S rRNA (cytidine1920-2'-O)/16S rRNA (cytidine1409-2'-O)-methyltransferase